MRTLFLALTAATITMTSHADTSTPRGTVDALFDAMRAGDGERVMEIVAEDASLARVDATGDVRPGSFADWAAWVDTQNPGDADERIFAVETQVYGSLASVWAPFTLVYQGNLVGCGVNKFTLSGQNGDWKIIHGIDIQDGGDCATFVERYMASQ